MVDFTLYIWALKALHTQCNTVVGVGLMYLHLCSQCPYISLLLLDLLILCLHLIQLLLNLVCFVQNFHVFCCYVFIVYLKYNNS